MTQSSDIYSLDPWSLKRIPFTEKHRLPKTTGIYFVFQNNRLLYIGKTERSFWARWSSDKGHHRSHQFASMSNIEIACWERSEKGRSLLRLEKTACQVFMPELNRVCKDKEARVPVKELTVRTVSKTPSIDSDPICMITGLDLEELLTTSPNLWFLLGR